MDELLEGEGEDTALLSDQAEGSEEINAEEIQATIEFLQELMAHSSKQSATEMGERHAPPPAPAAEEAPVAPEGEEAPAAPEAEPTDEELLALLGG